MMDDEIKACQLKMDSKQEIVESVAETKQEIHELALTLDLLEDPF